MPNRSRPRPSHPRSLRTSRAPAAASVLGHGAPAVRGDHEAPRRYRRAVDSKPGPAAPRLDPGAASPDGGALAAAEALHGWSFLGAVPDREAPTCSGSTWALAPDARARPCDPAADAARASFSAGMHFHVAGEAGLAEAAYREAIALDGSVAETHNNLGVLLCARGERDAGLAAFRHAVELRPDCPEALHNLALSLPEEGHAARPATVGRTTPLPSMERLPDGAPRFTLDVPFAALAGDGFETYSLELAGGGVDRDLRLFLEERLRDGDAFLDVGAGWGFAALAAATLPGRAVRVLALVDDPAREAVLRSALPTAAITGSLEALATDAPGQAPPDLLLADPSPHSGSVFLRVSDPGALPDVLAGSAGLIAAGRLACLAWRCRPGPDGESAAADRVVLESLSSLGFEHFRVAEDASGCSLDPFTTPSGEGHVFSLSPTCLTA